MERMKLFSSYKTATDIQTNTHTYLHMQFRHKNIDMGALGSTSLPPLQPNIIAAHFRSTSITEALQ